MGDGDARRCAVHGARAGRNMRGFEWYDVGGVSYVFDEGLLVEVFRRGCGGGGIDFEGVL